LALEGLSQELDEMTSRIMQVMKQTRARIFRGNTRSEGKLLSLFEPSTEVIRKSKAGKPNEFGKMVKLQEAENQIITNYEVYARRPYDSDLPIAAIETHQALLGRAPRLVAADAAFYILLRHSDRCRYKGDVGMDRWSASVSSPITSSTSVVPWKGRRLPKSADHRQVWQPRRGLRSRNQLITMPQTSILRREVARTDQRKQCRQIRARFRSGCLSFWAPESHFVRAYVQALDPGHSRFATACMLTFAKAKSCKFMRASEPIW
jgi:hypothetical protein